MRVKQSDIDGQIFALTAVARLMSAGRERLTYHPICAPMLVKIVRPLIHGGHRSKFAGLARVTESDVKEYDELSKHIVEMAASVKVFWFSMSQSDAA